MNNPHTTNDAAMTADPDLRQRLETIIFGTGTLAGRRFDMTLIGLILVSVLVVVLDSVPELNESVGAGFWYTEVFFTLIFTLEYGVRIWCTHNRRAYLFSFWGIVDLLAIIPTYIAFLYPDAAPLVVIRLFRVLRVFRVFRLIALFAELNEILAVLRSTSRSIFVFLVLVMLVVVVFACVIYVIEGPQHGFVSIPVSIYWAVVTITTVGYGDLVPQTPAGRFIAGFGMLVGYSIIAVPTAIITRKLWERINDQRNSQPTLPWNCPVCAKQGHHLDAQFCRHCGAGLDVPSDVREQAERQ
jgi:voltage-gated potassium channel